MSREIKFRAWGEENKEMYYPDGQYEFWIDNNSVGFYPRYDIDSMQHYNTIKSENEKSIKVMQFTGLTENAYEQKGQNKGIYDGDLIEFIDGIILAVEWNDDTCQWQYSDGSPLNSGERYATHKKIVGNIYESSKTTQP